MIDVNDIRILSNWKEVYYRAYDAYVCIPQFGTQRAEITKLQNLSQNLPVDIAKDMIFNIVEGNNNVGKAISFHKLKLLFSLNDNVIQINDILDKARILSDHEEVKKANNFMWIPNYYELEALAESHEIYFMDWIHVKRRTNTDSKRYAFFLDINAYQNFPVQTKNGVVLANGNDKQHGRGDFIVANGRPFMQYATVINGLEFPAMFSMQQFKGLYSSEELEKLRKLKKPSTIYRKKENNKDKTTNKNTCNSDEINDKMLEVIKRIQSIKNQKSEPVLEAIVNKKLYGSGVILVKAYNNKDIKRNIILDTVINSMYICEGHHRESYIDIDFKDKKQFMLRLKQMHDWIYQERRPEKLIKC